MKRNNLSDIHCKSCGAPAYFDIVKQNYTCSYCSGTVSIDEAIEEKKGFRSVGEKRIKASASRYALKSAKCSNCGADIVFHENEPLSSCEFCGSSLVRGEYLDDTEIPELIIPFKITEAEAKEQLLSWCRENSSKREAKNLLKHIDSISGYYLPYELIRGPVTSNISRRNTFRRYETRGFIEKEFVSSSWKLDNLLLDGMEPYNLDDLAEFDFNYVAGHKIKVSDITSKNLNYKISEEIEESYRPYITKLFNSNDIDIVSDISGIYRMPVLLPVYYVHIGETMAAVNGQTGKVSVRGEKDRFYLYLPWWLQAILTTVILGGLSFAAFGFFKMESGLGRYIAAMLTVFYMIVSLAIFSDHAYENTRVHGGREIYTSDKKALERKDGVLLEGDEDVERYYKTPVFFERLNGNEAQPVEMIFKTPLRQIKQIVTYLAVLFLPVWIKLFSCGFDLSKFSLGGLGAVYLCLSVPLVPIYYIVFGILEFYDYPWIYYKDENGKRKKYKEKKSY